MLDTARDCPGPLLFRNSLRAWQAEYKAQQTDSPTKDFRLPDLATPAGRQPERSPHEPGARRRRMFR